MTGTQSLWLGAVLLVGCGFQAAPGEEDTMVDPPGDPDPGLARKCATADGSLRLCIDFEDSAMDATDGSGRGHHPILVAGLSTLDRDAELAVEMSTSSKLQIAETADLDIPANLTVSMWVNSATRPAAGASYWLLDNNRQYALSIQPSGAVRCGLGPITVDSVASLNVAGMGWHHVACTHDGNNLKVYIDGWVAGCNNSSSSRPISTDGTEGLAIGSNIGASATGPVFTDKFVGGLDNVQVFARTWASSEICGAAGESDCSEWCPTFGNGPGGGGNGSDDD